MNEILNKIFAQVGVNLNLGSALLLVICALLMGMMVSAVYMYIRRKEGYRKDVVLTLNFIAPLVCMVMVLVGSNIVYALGMGGIFTLVRWRSLQTSQQDLTFTLFSVAGGAACGLGYVSYGFLFTVILGAAMILLDFLKYGENKSTTMRLKITTPEDLNTEGLFDDVLKEYTSHFQLIEVKTSNFGSLYDMIYMVCLKPETNRKDMIDKIRTKNGNLNVALTIYEIEKRKR